MRKFFIFLLFYFIMNAAKAQATDSMNKQPKIIYRMSIYKKGPALIPLDSNEMKQALHPAKNIQLETNLKNFKDSKSIPKQANETSFPVSESVNKNPPNK